MFLMMDHFTQRNSQTLFSKTQRLEKSIFLYIDTPESHVLWVCQYYLPIQIQIALFGIH
jgi:hypothetical protein